jgi:hypothetical protein
MHLRTFVLLCAVGELKIKTSKNNNFACRLVWEEHTLLDFENKVPGVYLGLTAGDKRLEKISQ